MAPDHDLIRAALDALRADAAVASLLGPRIYERAPDDPAPAFPYLSVGPTDAVPDDVDCRAGEEITFQLDVWSQGEGEASSSAECRTIADAVKRVLHDAELALSEHALIALTLRLKSIRRDRDGITNHGVLQFTGTVETP